MQKSLINLLTVSGCKKQAEKSVSFVKRERRWNSVSGGRRLVQEEHKNSGNRRSITRCSSLLSFNGQNHLTSNQNPRNQNMPYL